MEIMVLGDVVFLELVFDGIVAITGDGGFWQAIQVAVGLGVLVTVASAIFNGGRSINFGGLIGTVLLVLVGFSVTTTVVLTSARNPVDTRVVANVPMAVAGPAAIISNFGYWMTDWMTAAFGRPHRVTVEGFRYSFETLKQLRFSTRDYFALASLDGYRGGSFRQTAKNYLETCIFRRLNRQTITMNDVFDAGTWRTAIAYPDIPSEDRFQVLMGPSAGAIVRCADGWNNGMPGLGTMEQEIAAFIDHIRATKLPAVFQGAELLPPTPIEVETRLQNSMTDLGIVGIGPEDLIGAMLLIGIFDEAHVADALAYMDFQWAQMVRDGIRQRNAQWSAEGSLFLQMVGPMVTFMEGFAYGTLPMVAILIALGSFGFGFIARYMLMLLWLQTWLPGLAIVDLYLSMTFDAKLSAAQAIGGTGLGSFAGILLLDTHLSTAIAWGEHMAAIIPFLTAGFVWGGAVAATSMAAEVRRGDYIDEKRMIPSRTNAPEIVHREAPMTFDHHAGMRTTGVQLPTIRLSSVDADSVRFAESASQQAEVRLQSALREISSQGFSYSSEFSDVAGTGRSLRYEESRAASFISGNSDVFSDRLMSGISEASTISTAVAADITKGLMLGGAPGTAAAKALNNAGISAPLDLKQTTQGKAALDLAHDIQRKLSHDDSFRQGFSDSLVSDVEQVHRIGGGHSFRDESVRELSQAHSQATSARLLAEWAGESRTGMATDIVMPVAAVAQAMLNSGNFHAYQQIAQATGNFGAITHLGNMLTAHHGYDPKIAWASAFLLHMSGSPLRTGPVQGDPDTVRLWAHRAMAEYLPFAAPGGADRTEAENLRAAAPSPNMGVAAPSGGGPSGPARDQFAQNAPLVERDANAIRDRVDDQQGLVGGDTGNAYQDARDESMRPAALDRAVRDIDDPSYAKPGAHLGRETGMTPVPDSAHLPERPAGGSGTDTNGGPLTVVIDEAALAEPRPSHWDRSARRD